MLTGSKSNVHLFISPTSKVGDVVVCLDIPANCSVVALKKLKTGCACNCCKDNKGEACQCFPKDSEMTALCYSLMLAVRQKLAGTPLEVLKSKVGNVSGTYHNGCFSICWKVQGTVSAVRKSIGLALTVLSPARAYPIYQDCMRTLGAAPSREEFNHVAHETIAELKKKIQIGVVGKIKADKSKLTDMLDVLHKKVRLDAADGAKKKPGDHKECCAECCEVKCDGWASCLLKDYINFRVKGLAVEYSTKGVCINCKDSRWDSVSKKIKPGVKEFMSAKYGKVKDDLHPILAYMLMSSCSICAHDAHKLLHEAPSVSKMESEVAKCL